MNKKKQNNSFCISVKKSTFLNQSRSFSINLRKMKTNVEVLKTIKNSDKFISDYKLNTKLQNKSFDFSAKQKSFDADEKRLDINFSQNKTIIKPLHYKSNEIKKQTPIFSKINHTRNSKKTNVSTITYLYKGKREILS